MDRLHAHKKFAEELAWSQSLLAAADNRHRDEALDARLKMHQTRIAGALRAVPPAAVISGDLPRSPAEIFWQGERERIQLDAVMWQGEEKVDQKVVKWKT